MKRHNTTTYFGWLLTAVSFIIYRLTMAPTVSFWDCGEFIATNHKLMIGHPPGAPLYQLIAHLFTLLASSPEKIAFWSNMTSVVSASVTVGFLYWTLIHLTDHFIHNENTSWKHHLAAAVGALSYCVCDTAWFSAVESEVYAMSMLVSSTIVWASVRWYQCATPQQGYRWILLIALLGGMAPCIHLMSLLALPYLAVLLLFKKHNDHKQGQSRHWILPTIPIASIMLIIGLSPMIIIPLRADNRMPINEGDPSTFQNFRSYLSRDQYEKSPLVYPRIWRQRANDATYYRYWSGNHGHYHTADGTEVYDPNFIDNLQFFSSYQLQYMYLRYFFWNFCGRYNDRMGLGSLQNGQFIVGIPPIDRLLVGTGQWQPRDAMHRERQSHTCYFLLPLILGIWGLIYNYRHRAGFWSNTTLFLLSSIGLAIYLNMPCYQPRERDYAFVLSFYAWCLWIGIGTLAFIQWASHKHIPKILIYTISLAVPALMAAQNYPSHNRRHNQVARNTAWNTLNSCEKNAILFCVGDNDTFPLWYLQQVEGIRTDVQIVNTSLISTRWYSKQIANQLAQQGSKLLVADSNGLVPIGVRAFEEIILSSGALTDSSALRPIYLTPYAFNEFREHFKQHLQLTGIAYRLGPYSSDTVACEEFLNHLNNHFVFTPVDHFIDYTSQKFVEEQLRNVIILSNNLVDKNQKEAAYQALHTAFDSVQLECINDPTLLLSYSHLLSLCNREKESQDLKTYLCHRISIQQRYYNTLSNTNRTFIPYTLRPIQEVATVLEEQGD